MLRDVSQQRVLPGAEPTMKLNVGSVPKALTPKQEKALTPEQKARKYFDFRTNWTFYSWVVMLLQV